MVNPDPTANLSDPKPRLPGSRLPDEAKINCHCPLMVLGADSMPTGTQLGEGAEGTVVQCKQLSCDGAQA